MGHRLAGHLSGVTQACLSPWPSNFGAIQEAWFINTNTNRISRHAFPSLLVFNTPETPRQFQPQRPRPPQPARPAMQYVNYLPPNASPHPTQAPRRPNVLLGGGPRGPRPHNARDTAVFPGRKPPLRTARTQPCNDTFAGFKEASSASDNTSAIQEFSRAPRGTRCSLPNARPAPQPKPGGVN